MAKRLGVIGGLGPLATAYFYELISQMTDVKLEQEHIDITIISKPSIPDRTNFILGRSSDSPLPHMIELGKTLVSLGANYIAIPCITAHYFHKELSESIDAPIIHIICETVKYLKRHNVKRAGIMATEGTIESQLFQNELISHDIEPIIPSIQSQAYVTSLIYNNVKAGKPINMEQFNEVKEELKNHGADTIILGCTELSIIKREKNIGPGFIDALEVLAMCSIIGCGAKLKRQYMNLIT